MGGDPDYCGFNERGGRLLAVERSAVNSFAMIAAVKAHDGGRVLRKH
jgi:hypothetical protein